mgnify:FL=1|jgi:hypothetical protein|tara:strand:- start:1062 stop:1163 length:102 start_codon:yes stop_codon:yes gene_type:complete
MKNIEKATKAEKDRTLHLNKLKVKIIKSFFIDL